MSKFRKNDDVQNAARVLARFAVKLVASRLGFGLGAGAVGVVAENVGLIDGIVTFCFSVLGG